MRYGAVMLACLAVSAHLSGDTLQMRDGKVYQGRYLGGGAQVLQFETGGRTQRFSIDRVRSLTFGPEGQANGVAGRHDVYPKDRDYNDFPPDSSNGKYPTGAAVKIPSTTSASASIGTDVFVRMTDPIDAAQMQAGKTYRGALTQALKAGNTTLAPAGAGAVLKAVKSSDGGVALQLVQIVTGGKIYQVSAALQADAPAWRTPLAFGSQLVFKLSQPLTLQ